jgi:hypothetical protein
MGQPTTTGVCRIQIQLGRCGRAHRGGHGICQSRDRELGDHGTQLQRAPAQEGRSIPSIQQLQKTLWEPSMEQLGEVYNVNVTGVLYTAIAFLDLLDKGNQKKNIQQTSHVLVTSS